MNLQISLYLQSPVADLWKPAEREKLADVLCGTLKQAVGAGFSTVLAVQTLNQAGGLAVWHPEAGGGLVLDMQSLCTSISGQANTMLCCTRRWALIWNLHVA